MQNVDLSVPNYVLTELKARDINPELCTTVLMLDNSIMIELFSLFIQTEHGSDIIEESRSKGDYGFCLDEGDSFILGCVFPEADAYIDVKILPFSITTTDDIQDILDAIAHKNLWTLNFKYNTATNEISNVSVNWDVLLKMDLKGMVDDFMKHKSKNKFH